MTVSFNAADDFPRIVDRLQEVTLVRSGGPAAVTVAGALRAAVATAEARASRGRVTKSDVVWHLPGAELTTPPAPGDVIVDADARRWTVLGVRQTTADSRWRCLCRELAVAQGLDQIVDIDKATYLKSRHGAEQIAWHVWRSGVTARVQLVRSIATEQYDRQRTTHQYVVTLAEQLVLDHTHRIRTPDGAVYRVVGCRNVDRIDALVEVDAVGAGQGRP